MAPMWDFLEDTMLASAGHGYKKSLTCGDDLSRWNFFIDASDKPNDKTEAEDAAIWGYSVPTIGGGVHLTDLICRVKSMDYMNMGVCDSIDWAPVTFTTEHTSGPVTLPLETEFLWKTRILSAGTVTGDDKYWKLYAKTDYSWELIFAYEFRDFENLGKPEPVVKADLREFSPKSAEKQSRVSVFPPGTPQSCTLRVSPLRIMVVVTLVCCKLRDDFDPGGVLGAGRFYPMIMVLSNHDLKTVTGKITVKRPPQIKMLPDDPGGNPHCHSSPEGSTVMMGEEEMTENLSTAFFTDANDTPVIPSASWASIFDYYECNPAMGSYVMAVPWKIRRSRTIPGLEVSRNAAWKNMGITNKDTPLYVKRTPVVKMAGQGEFDNIHIAPKMVIRPENVRPFINGHMSTPIQLTGLDNITMAPFCIHDCMHLHTRWSADVSGKQAKGWSDEETPNSLAGAPVVPPNQKVTLNLLSPTSFEYVAEARNVRTGAWQIMFHHGAGYALDFESKATVARLAGPSGGMYATKGVWSEFYWRIRWDYADGVQYERLTWPAGALPKLRETGSLPEDPGL
jgi:hypothetical protein